MGSRTVCTFGMSIIDIEHPHILGIEPGATEDAASVKPLLTHLLDHGLATDFRYLFIIDRVSIEEGFRCEVVQGSQRGNKWEDC